MGSALQSIDVRLSRLVSAGEEQLQAFKWALDHGDPLKLLAVLSTVYGAPIELICIQQSRGVLVFDGGVGVLVGYRSWIHMLTFGYQGRGPTNFTTFLAACGFVDPDAEHFDDPMLLRRDGTKLKGTLQGHRIRWPDWSSILVPPFQNDKLDALANGDRTKCWACGKDIEVRVFKGGIAHFDLDEFQVVMSARNPYAQVCSRCGFVSCYRCTFPAGETSRTACPACRAEGSTYYFTE